MNAPDPLPAYPQPRGLVSLWDMYKFNAEPFYSAVTKLAELTKAIDAMEAQKALDGCTEIIYIEEHSLKDNIYLLMLSVYKAVSALNVPVTMKALIEFKDAVSTDDK